MIHQQSTPQERLVYSHLQRHSYENVTQSQILKSIRRRTESLLYPSDEISPIVSSPVVV